MIHLPSMRGIFKQEGIQYQLPERFLGYLQPNGISHWKNLLLLLYPVGAAAVDKSSVLLLENPYLIA
jgi:hypothetical protein